MIIDGKTGGYRRAQAEISPGTGGDIAGHGRGYRRTRAEIFLPEPLP